MRMTANAPQTMGALNAVPRIPIAGARSMQAMNVGDPWSDMKGSPEAEYS